MENRLLKRIYNNNLPQAKQTPTKRYIRHICDFSRDMLNTPNLSVERTAPQRKYTPMSVTLVALVLNAQHASYLNLLRGHRYRYIFWEFWPFTLTNSYLMYYLNARYSPMTLPTIENGESCGTMIGSIVSFSG